MVKNPFRMAPTPNWQQLNKSKGILDDYAVRRSVATREGSIEKVPSNNTDIVNKAYADSINFWQRVGTVLSPKTAGDDISTTGDMFSDHISLGGLAATPVPAFGESGFIAWPNGSMLMEQVSPPHTNRMIYLPNGGRLDVLTESGSSYGSDIYAGDFHHRRDGSTGRSVYGASGDTAIYFDGSDMIIKSNNVTANDELLFQSFTEYNFDNNVISTGDVSGATLTAGDGFTGTGAYTNFTIVNGIITAAS